MQISTVSVADIRCCCCPDLAPPPSGWFIPLSANCKIERSTPVTRMAIVRSASMCRKCLNRQLALDPDRSNKMITCSNDWWRFSSAVNGSPYVSAIALNCRKRQFAIIELNGPEFGSVFEGEEGKDEGNRVEQELSMLVLIREPSWRKCWYPWSVRQYIQSTTQSRSLNTKGLIRIGERSLVMG